MRKAIAGIFFVIAWSAYGQGSFSNEWINFTQSYFKIPVVQTGIYRLTFTDLQNAGLPAVDPRTIQIYHRGKEQAIFFKHNQVPANGQFEPGEYLEFYGQKNDGTLDADLYQPSSLQPHSRYNLYSDTAAYFLTWNNALVQGKRMETFFENNVTNQPKENFQIQEQVLILANQYSAGKSFGDYTQISAFDEGEGWTGEALSQGQSKDYTLESLVNGVISSSVPQLEIQLLGRDRFPHTADVYVGPSAGTLRLLTTESFPEFESRIIKLPLAWTDIGVDGKLTVRVAAAPATNNRPQFSVSYIQVKFNQTFDFNTVTQRKFSLPVNTVNKSYIELTNAASDLRVWDVTDPNNVIVIGTRLTGSTLSAMVNATTSARTLFASNQLLTSAPKRVSFRAINPANHNYLIITNRALMKPTTGYNDPVKGYAIYRASNAGGNYDTLTVPVDLLYDQFNYGETSPRAIYQFVKFMAQGNPKYIFLIGKGRDIGGYSPYLRKPLQVNEIKDLVPSAGFPASDMLFSAGLKGTTYEPAIPVGRLPATEPLHVASYLNKIKETETTTLPADWKKKILHLSGGIRDSELIVFRNNLDGFKATAEREFFGGEVTTIAKRDPSVTELINISEKVNEGVNLITFFGHSSPGTIDIDIGFATNPTMGYNNPGKYPAFLINGCSAGSFFLNGRIFGEDWILAANKGARGFMAHSSFGYSNILNAYTDLFYSTAFADTAYLKLGIGDVQKQTSKRLLADYGNSPFIIAQAQQIIYLGDPAVKLFGTAQPDYDISDDRIKLISLDNQPVTATSNAFGLEINLRNLGAYRNKPFTVRVKRTLPDNTLKSYDSLFAPLFYRDTIIFKLKRDPNGAGENKFEVTIDADQKITEGNEANNIARLTVSIPSASTFHLFPAPYAIATTSNVEFTFQDSNLLGNSRSFQLEIDTLAGFESPFKISRTINAKVLAKLNINLLPRDSVVYYWRTKFTNPAPGEGKDWTVSSFTVIRNSQEGWAQLRNSQLKNNQLSQITLNPESNKFQYLETVASLLITTYGANHPAPHTDVSVRIDNAEYNLATQGQPCRDNTINIIAFNKSTLVPYAGIPFTFEDPRTCGREPQVINSYLASEIETSNGEDLIKVIDNIKASDSVVLFSIGDAGINTWSTTIKAKLGELGISLSQLNSLQAGEPLVIRGRKGAPTGTAKLFRTNDSNPSAAELQVNGTLTGRPVEARVNSVRIGPSVEWKSFKANVSEKTSSDEVSFNIYGQTNNGAQTLLFSSITTSKDLSSINASQYPYLIVEAKLKDEVNLTVAQLRNWIVLFEPAPEAMIIFLGNPATQTVQEGQTFQTQFGLINLSKKNFTSTIPIRYETQNVNSGLRDIKVKEVAAPLPADTSRFSVNVSTIGRVGFNHLSINSTNSSQPEWYAENNTITLDRYIQVLRDQIAPRLDVTVDGRYLMNGDIVSPNPTIDLKLFDENPYLFKADTTGIIVSLTSPCTQAVCLPKPVYFKNQTWTTATTNSPFVAQLKLKNLADGIYTLQIDAKDVSGNRSGTEPYQITFEVRNESAFEFQSVYPNPSRTQFRFRFLVSGNELPEDFTLEIFNSNGGRVRAFTLDDVRQFIIGTNELTWSRTDAEGYALDEGIYFYRLRLKLKGNESAQQGKLYLLR